ncbi:MAG: hypothetical protein HQL32_04565 [Planctomycetes bacterium]|nr:hypothetical protein [Planctomycetota bacterium]
MSLLELSLFLAGLPVVLLLPTLLGKRLYPHFEYTGQATALGWVALSFLLSLLALLGLLNREFVVIMLLAMNAFLYKEACALLRNFFSEVRKLVLESDGVGKCLLLVIAALLIMRFSRCFLPTLNWDSLNSHLLLLRERLNIGDLSPIYNIPTDRRVPLGGLFCKMAAYVFDPAGRTVIVAHFGIYVTLISLVYQMMVNLTNRKSGLIVLGVYVSISELMIYMNGLGDEALLSLMVMSGFAFFTSKDHIVRPGQIMAAWAFLGFTFAIKMTALFWAPALAILLLWKFSKQIKWSLLGILFALIIASVWQYRTWHEYETVYPFLRWSNLLHEGGKDMKSFNLSYVKDQRVEWEIGLHRDGSTVVADPIGRFQQNLIRLPRLPLGPYLLWALLLAVFLLAKKAALEKQEKKTILACLAFAAMAILPSMLAWKFTPQAMFRYHLPTWGPFLLALSLLMQRGVVIYGLRTSVMLLLVFHLCFQGALEAKVLFKEFRRDHLLSPVSYWQKYSAEGELLSLMKKRIGEEKIMYLGINCALVPGEGHWYIQIPNETGWRAIEEIPVFLNKQNIQYWVLSAANEGLDEPLYRKLTQILEAQGVLTLYDSCSQGKIFTVRSSDSVHPR